MNSLFNLTTNLCYFQTGYLAAVTMAKTASLGTVRLSLTILSLLTFILQTVSEIWDEQVRSNRAIAIAMIIKQLYLFLLLTAQQNTRRGLHAKKKTTTI
jgi:hypothetical protein